MIGSLMYLTNMRLDICFVVNTLSHFLTVEKCSLDCCKEYFEVPEGYSWLWAQVWGESKDYVDSYWAGSATDRKSTSRCFFSMGSSVISWFGRMQSYMALSTAEEKYVVTCCFGGSMFLLKTTIWFGWSDLHFVVWCREEQWSRSRSLERRISSIADEIGFPRM